jgi:hypothetical protein
MLISRSVQKIIHAFFTEAFFSCGHYIASYMTEKRQWEKELGAGDRGLFQIKFGQIEEGGEKTQNIRQCDRHSNQEPSKYRTTT